MKDYFSRLQKYWFVFTVLIFLLLFFWWIDGFNIKDISVNIAASMATLVGTLFILDVFTEKNKENEYKIAKSVVRDDITVLTNMLTSHFTSPLGVTIHDVEEKPGATLDLASSPKQMLKMIKLTEERDIQETMQRMSISDWNEFYLNLLLVKNAISENIVLYKDLVSPEMLGYLLKVRRSFNSMYMPFSFLPELFLKEEKDYPANKGGIQANRQYRKGLILVLAKDLTEYFSYLKTLINYVQKLYD